MKIAIVSLLGLMAIVSGEFEVYEDGVVYDSENLGIFISSTGDSSIRTKELDAPPVSLDSSRLDEQIVLSSINFGNLRVSRQGMDELSNSLAKWAKVANSNKQLFQQQIHRSANVTSNSIYLKDPWIGMQLLAATNGLAYLETPAGVIVQVTPNSIKVKDINGQLVQMDTSQMSPELETLSAAFAKEAQHWVSFLRPASV